MKIALHSCGILLAIGLGMIACASASKSVVSDVNPPVKGAEASQSCGQVPIPLVASSLPHEGRYSIVFIAEQGSKANQEVSGTLTLRHTSMMDRSPVTGEGPSETRYLGETPLFGWFDGDLSMVGAPIRSYNGIPLPNSQDPIYPGVLLYIWHKTSGYPEGTPVLCIASALNDRTDRMILDGPGIGLWVHASNVSSFSGQWYEMGLESDGSGHFCATSIKEMPPN